MTMKQRLNNLIIESVRVSTRKFLESYSKSVYSGIYKPKIKSNRIFNYHKFMRSYLLNMKKNDIDSYIESDGDYILKVIQTELEWLIPSKSLFKVTNTYSGGGLTIVEGNIN